MLAAQKEAIASLSALACAQADTAPAGLGYPAAGVAVRAAEAFSTGLRAAA